MTETTSPKPASLFDDEERFKQIAGTLIALVTILTAIVGYLQNDAGSLDDRANRQAQEYAFQAMGQRISGAAQAGYARGDAYRTWSELNTLALTAQIDPFTFAEAQYDEDGEFVDYIPADSFPAGTDEVLIVFDYKGMQDGQAVVWKVYYNGEEDVSWRTVEDWSLGAAGTAEFPLSYAYSNVYTLASGEYLVEMYVDSHLAQRGYFVIEEETEVLE